MANNTLKPAKPYDNSSWLLTQRDSEIIVDAMENPPKPSQALIDVFKDFKHLHDPDVAWDGDYITPK